MLFKILIAASLAAAIAGFASSARASEFLKCTQQAINPYTGKPMSAGRGQEWIKRDGDKLTLSNPLEMQVEQVDVLRQAAKNHK